MVVRIRCVHCGHRFRESEAVLGRSIPCPACGQWLKVETGLTLSGEATFARVSAGQAPQPQPEVPKPKRQKEPSLWRNPAIWIGFATIAALVIVFLSVVGHEPEAFEASSPEQESTEPPSTVPDDASRQATAAGQPPKRADSDAPSSSEIAEKSEQGPSGDRTGQGEETTPSSQVESTEEPAVSKPTESVPSPSDETQPQSPRKETGPSATAERQEESAKAGLSASDIFKRSSPAVVQIVVRNQNLKAIGQGSGFLVSSDGIVITNYHVVSKAEFATVVLPSKATLFVEGLLALDEDADLAVLKVNGTGLPYLKLTHRNRFPEVGSRVYAVGSPRGFANSLSEGLISGLRKVSDDLKLIQTTAAISPGSSGGPLLDADGSVIGVTSATVVGPASQNLNFAVPAPNIHRILKEAGGSQPQPLVSAGGRPLVGQASEDLQKAWKAIEDERWTEAVDAIQRLRPREPDNPQVYFVLGFLHVRLGNNDLAVEAFGKQVRLAPNGATGYFGLGMAYYNLERYREAMSSLRKAVRVAPNFWPSHTYLGMSLYALDRHRESVNACKEAIRLRPDIPLAYYYLGLNYITMQDRQRAISTYRTLLRLDPRLAEELHAELYGP